MGFVASTSVCLTQSTAGVSRFNLDIKKNFQDLSRNKLVFAKSLCQLPPFRDIYY